MPIRPDPNSLSHAQKDERILTLSAQVQTLTAQLLAMQDRITHLEARLSLNSKNSSKPPSSDGLTKPNPKSSRVAGLRATGGQKGHDGNTLRQSAQVDQVITHHGLPSCPKCQGEWLVHEVVERRQIFELPVLRAQVTEHQLMRSTCSCGQVHEGQWPQGINASAQYGERVKALVVHLNQHHLVPMARTCEIMKDVFGLSLCQGSLQAFNQQAARTLEPVVAAIGVAAQGSPVVHADETGIRVMRKLHWLHCLVTDSLTWLGCHSKRGSVAFDAIGLLGGVRGTLVHDGLAGYKQFDCKHSLCNAHHLRELTFVHEQEHIWDSWAQEMKDLLLLAKVQVDQVAGPLSPERQAWFAAQWEALLVRGEAFNPENIPEGAPRGTQGRHKQSKAYNLLKRLRVYRADVWRFMTDEGVPFTNNLAEQALRMSKVRQKVSGCFRTQHGGDTFFTIRSYLATMNKQGACLFECLISTFKGQPIQPRLTG